MRWKQWLCDGDIGSMCPGLVVRRIRGPVSHKGPGPHSEAGKIRSLMGRTMRRRCELEWEVGDE